MFSSRKQKTKASFPVQIDLQIQTLVKNKDKKETKFEFTY